MSTFRHKNFSSHAKFNKSEQLALKNGFKMVPDEDAYNGRYFMKNGKKWIHNLDALKKQLRTNDNRVLEHYGYDVEAYLSSHY